MIFDKSMDQWPFQEPIDWRYLPDISRLIRPMSGNILTHTHIPIDHSTGSRLVAERYVIMWSSDVLEVEHDQGSRMLLPCFAGALFTTLSVTSTEIQHKNHHETSAKQSKGTAAIVSIIWVLIDNSCLIKSDNAYMSMIIIIYHPHLTGCSQQLQLPISPVDIKQTVTN